MGSKSKIEWTEDTWNPIVGCSIATPGCTNCYAMKMANRIVAMNPNSHYAGTVQDSKAGAVWTGKVALAPEKILTAPLRRKKPTMYFVNSMGDAFHESVPDEWIDKVFAVMALCPQHTFQVLTKRAERMKAYVSATFSGVTSTALYCLMHEIKELAAKEPERTLAIGRIASGPLSNVWLGVSTERQKEAEERIPLLLNTPAAKRFISAEPLLGPIDLNEVIPHPISYSFKHGFNGLDWVIVGGESGKKVRPMHPDWARSLRDQCKAAGVPFFFKQWGAYCPDGDSCVGEAGGSMSPDVAWPDGSISWGHKDDHGGWGMRLARVGKKSAGRLLDGVEHNGMPA